MDALFQHIAKVDEQVILTLSDGKSYQGKFLNHNSPYAKFDCIYSSDNLGSGDIYINTEHITTISYPVLQPEQVVDGSSDTR